MITLAANPSLRIIHRHGRFLAWEPAFSAAQTVTAADIIIVAAMLESRDPLEALTRTGSICGEAEIAAADAAGVAARIERLRQLGILLEPPPVVPHPTSSLAFDRIPRPGEAELGPRLHLPRNFALQATPGAFVAWSRTLRQRIALPPEVILLMLGFAESRDPQEVAARVHAAGAHADPEETLHRLQAAHLLMPGPSVAASGELSTVRGRRSIEKHVHLRSDDPWRAIRPDGRTPIYFVSHSPDHLPLALGMMRAYLGAYEDGKLLEHYNPLPIVWLTPEEVLQVYRQFGPGVWLFSNYMWSLKYNLDFSHSVHRELGTKNITIHGGPSTPKYEGTCTSFLKAHAHVDIAVRGEGEVTFAEILEAIAAQELGAAAGCPALENIPGITFFPERHRSGSPLRTPERARALELDRFPSPYLEGLFDNYGGRVISAILETNRGCPYACTFCDWGSATQQKIKRFDLARIEAEIDWIGRKRIRVLWIADANFGIFPRDIDIAAFIAATKARYGYPKEVVVNYPKNATKKIAEIVKILARSGICSQGIISIQSTDPETLRVIRRSNIKTAKYDELAEIFRAEDLPLSTDLMIGLPGATVESFKRDLQYYFDDDIGVKAYPTQLLPNSPMADPAYLRQYQIKTDDEGFLISTSSYSWRDREEMLWLYSVFDIADGYGVLRYVLRFLQWEHGIRATDFLHAMAQHIRSRPREYPAITWMLRHFLVECCAPGGWGAFYEEVGQFAAVTYGIERREDFELVLWANELLMPDEGRSLPESVLLPHDLVSYFKDNERTSGPARRPLASYPPGRLDIADPFDLCRQSYEEIEQYDNHQVFWELSAPISRRRSDPNFVERRSA